LLIPKYPGVTILNGPPCAFGNGTPFISQASIASLKTFLGTDLSIIAFLGSRPVGTWSTPADVI
jgi:hypothetical protein